MELHAGHMQHAVVLEWAHCYRDLLFRRKDGVG